MNIPKLNIKQHNVMDYVDGSLVVASPFLFRFSHIPAARNVCIGLGLGTIAYSLMTKYDYSVAKVIPLGPHMALDVASGASLMAAPFTLGYAKKLSKVQLALHFVMGMSASLLVALTKPRTESARISALGETLESKWKGLEAA